MSRALDRNQRKATVALRRLATGSRVERASDGAAELARVNALRAQLAGYRAASRSIEANQALLRTAETALGEQMTILQRMRELTVRYSSGSLSAVDRTHIQAEFETSRSELDRIAEQTQFNGHPLLTGAAQTLGLTLGPSPGDRLSYSLRASRSGSLGTVHELTTSAYNANIVLADQDAFASGDVLLSGSPVRPTVACDDSVSSQGAAASAIA
ncbi:MAG: flagellin [Myxococcota bacterium]